MTQKDKELLIKDLCARLPYGVKVVVPELEHGTIYEVVGIDRNTISVKKDNGSVFLIPDVIGVFPYLRSMSSMTEEERNNLRAYCRTQEGIIYDIGVAGAINSPAIIDWLNAHHFDYRGLIPKGLALPAPEKMYNLK